ncbi:MAG: hypothetical protein WAW37_08990 [Syntrophobacteraceae bacterium]
MGRSRYKFLDTNVPYFMTFTVLHWIPVFTRPETVNILLDSFKYLINEGLKIFAYVILENHIHLIAQSERIDRDVARLKSYTSKQLIAFLNANQVKTILDQLAFYKKAHKSDRTYQFWQEGVHPELIHTVEMMRQKVEYIHQNPVTRGYVDRPEHWRFSSARNYLGIDGLLEVCIEW